MLKKQNTILVKLAVLIMITQSFLCEKIKEKEEAKVVDPKADYFGLSKLFEAITTLFLSGLCDRSFFITTFMAIKYPKMLVMISAGLALSLVGVLSVFLGVAINKYIPAVYVDIFSVALFFFFGIKMVLEGLNMPKNEDLIKLEAAHQKIMEEEGENFISTSTSTAMTQATHIPHGHAHGLSDVQKECENFGDSEKFSNFKIFSKIFILIFASEIGDRSQISTIFLTNNFDKFIVIVAVVVSQNLLTIIAIFGGVLISNKISERNLTIIAGITFIAFGIIALYLVCANELFIFGKNTVLPKQTNIKNDIIPEKVNFGF